MFTSYEGNNCILFTETCLIQLRTSCFYSSDSLQRQHFIRFVYKCRRTDVQINYIFSDKVRILSVSLPGLPVLYITKPDTSLVTINTCIQKLDSVCYLQYDFSSILDPQFTLLKSSHLLEVSENNFG